MSPKLYYMMVRMTFSVAFHKQIGIAERRYTSIKLAVLPLLILSSAINAQNRQMPLVRSSETRKDDYALVGRARKGLAQCYYRFERLRMESLLKNSDPVSVNMDKVLNRDTFFSYEMNKCNQKVFDRVKKIDAFRSTPLQMRSMYQEEVYLAANRIVPKIANSETEKVDRTFISVGEELNTAQQIAGIADCIVFRNPAEADWVLRTMPGTDEEIAAAKALSPALRECLPQGQTFKLNHQNIRTLVADGLWTRFVFRRK